MNMEASLNTQLANAVLAVVVANDRLDHFREVTSQARRDETTALNNANQAQKHFDELVAMVKKLAPRETDWKRHGGTPVNAGP